MPPWEEIRDPMLYGFMLPLAVSAFVFFAVSRLLPRHGAVLAGVLAIIAGFFAGNHFREVIKFRIDSDRPLEARELIDAAYRATLGIDAANENAAKIPTQYWLPWAALLAGVAGLVSRIPRCPCVLSWLMAIAISVLSARLMVEADLRAKLNWLWPAFALAVLMEWKVIECVGRNHPGVWPPLGIGMAFLAASIVIVHAHSGSLGEIAAIFAGGWLGVAIASRHRDGGGAAPLSAVLLPSLMLIAQQSTYSEVPLKSFLLVALSPLAFAPVLLLRALGATSPRLIIVGFALLAIVNALAVGLAAQAESIAVD